jgi:hypothetical protein
VTLSGRATVCVVGAALLLAGCRAGEQQAGPPTATNFTGAGPAHLELAGETFTFAVACESTGVDGTGTLLISGRGTRADQVAIAVSAEASLGDGTGSMGANLGGDPPKVVQAPDAVVESGPPLRITGNFESIGVGTLVVEGCSPGP